MNENNIKTNRLGQSRKFEVGTIHRNASGEFEVVGRFIGEGGKPWLSYKWLSGEKVGQVEQNKEENVNSSLYRFRVTRGMQTVGDDKGKGMRELFESIDRMEMMLKSVMDRINKV